MARIFEAVIVTKGAGHFDESKVLRAFFWFNLDLMRLRKTYINIINKTFLVPNLFD